MMKRKSGQTESQGKKSFWENKLCMIFSQGANTPLFPEDPEKNKLLITCGQITRAFNRSRRTSGILALSNIRMTREKNGLRWA